MLGQRRNSINKCCSMLHTPHAQPFTRSCQVSVRARARFHMVRPLQSRAHAVLLTRDDEFETWLRGSPEQAFALAREYLADRMRIVQEGFSKQDPVTAA
jgi:hypothetical protein